MRSLSTELKVGMFAAAIIVILAYATVKVSERSVLATGGYELAVVLDTVTGLKKKAPIELAGVHVGVIKDIKLIDSSRARVTFFIDDRVKLPRNSKAVLRTRGFMGETYVDLVPGTPDAGFYQQGETIGSSAMTGDINSLVGSLNTIADDIKAITGTLRETTVEGEEPALKRIVENLDRFTQAMKELTVQNQENINTLASNMAVVAAELRAMVVQGRKDVEDSLAAIASIAGKIDRGEGTVGKLINDDATVEKLNEAADSLNEALGGIRKMELQFGYHAEYLTDSDDIKNYVHLQLKPTPDKAFLFDLIADPDPRPTHVQRTTEVTAGGTTSTVVTDTATVDRNKIRISAQLAKSFYDFTVRGGMIESTGGFGMDYVRGPIGVHFDAFDFSTRFNERPHLKAMANVDITRNFYLLGGADDFIRPNHSVDWFVGAGFRLIDDDLKSVLGLGAAASLR